VTALGVAVSSGDRSYSTQLVAYRLDTEMHRFLSDSGDWIPLPETGVLGGQSLRTLLDVSVGDPVQIRVPGTDTAFEVPVVGFVNEPLGTSVYISDSALNALVPASGGTGSAAGNGAVTTAELRYEEGVDRGAVRDALMATSGVVAVSDARALLETLNSFLGLFYAFVGMMLLFGGLMAGALIFTSMSANVAERAGELAGLRAAGMSLSSLSRLVSVENLLTAFLGVPPGLIVGYYVSDYFMASFSSDLFQFNLEMRWTTPIFSAIGVLLLALLAQLPALRGLRGINLGTVLRSRSL
jgi:putative ABC transport system permease protein